LYVPTIQAHHFLHILPTRMGHNAALHCRCVGISPPLAVLTSVRINATPPKTGITPLMSQDGDLYTVYPVWSISGYCHWPQCPVISAIISTDVVSDMMVRETSVYFHRHSDTFNFDTDRY